LLGAQSRSQERKYDGKPGKAGHKDEQSGGKGEDRQEKDYLQGSGDLLGTFYAVQVQMHGRHIDTLGVGQQGMDGKIEDGNPQKDGGQYCLS
jgi:hypothetical protein